MSITRTLTAEIVATCRLSLDHERLIYLAQIAPAPQSDNNRCVANPAAAPHVFSPPLVIEAARLEMTEGMEFASITVWLAGLMVDITVPSDVWLTLTDSPA